MLGGLRFGARVGIRIARSVFSTAPIAIRAKGKPTLYMFEHVRPFSALNEEQSLDAVVEELCGTDADLERRLRVLMLEVEVMRQDGRNAPAHLITRQWKELLELPTRSQRNNYLRFLFKIEKSKENHKAKQQQRKEEYESKPRPEKVNSDEVEYGLQENALFLRIRDSSINTFDNLRALQAIMYGQSLVIDCSYERNMVPREATNAAKQLTLAFGDNRVDREPFNMHLCNVNPNGKTIKQLHRNIPTISEPWFPLSLHEKSYTDLFPHKDLVYLTPHCRDELTEYDNEAVYIIGCMVDKTNNEPLSLARAKKDGIRMAKLPLDRYLEWAPGSGKCLNINHMVRILLDLKRTGDWHHALRNNVPRRKLMETKIEAVQKNMSKFNPLFIKSLKSNTFNNSPKFTPRNYNNSRFSYPKYDSQNYNNRKLNVDTLFSEDNKF